MTYVPNQMHDVFVSYAHVDDLLFPGVEEGWVTTLVKLLNVRLAQLLGRSDAYDMWIDQELSRHAPVTPEIMAALRETAILLVILSPGYLQSEWCDRELSAFLDLVKDKARSGSRVFVVERERVAGHERPPELKELTGYVAWVEDRKGKAPRILGSPKPADDDRKYYELVDDLSLDIVKELRRLKAAAEATTQAGPPAAVQPAGRTVFLAETTDDLDAERASVKRYLDQAGIAVLPETYLPLEPAAFRQAVERDLGRSHLFVQLLSTVPGKRPPGLARGYASLQHELAAAHGKQILQWRSPGLDVAAVEDADQRRLLELVTVCSESLEDFKREVRRQATEPLDQRPAAPAHAFIFVNREGSDRHLASNVCDVLDEVGAEYALPIESLIPSENRQDLERSIRDSDGVIIVYGSTTVAWVREQLRQCRKISIQRPTPLQALAVFEGPPEDKPELDLKLHNMEVLNCRTGFAPDKLRQFLGRLQPGALQ